MTIDEIRPGMIIDITRHETNILVIKDINEYFVVCERFQRNDSWKGDNWHVQEIPIEIWNDNINYTWSRYPEITGRKAVMKFFKDK